MLERIVRGELAAKPHTALRSPEGFLRYEECITRAGFDGPYTIVYHERRPHEARSVPAEHGFRLPEASGLRPLARRHYLSQSLDAGGSPLGARRSLLFNRDVVISIARPDRDDPVYFSNGDADDLYFVLAGGGILRSLLGDLHFETNDYLCVPRGILHRFVLSPGVSQHWLSIECLGGLGLPRQWRNEVGQLRMDAPYGHRDFRAPVFTGSSDEGIRDLVVKRGNRFHGFRYASSPLDLVGWDGSVYPWVFPILAFQPRVGSVHLPPIVHGTFAARGALVCSFVPRPLDFHPDAVPCPYPHSSVDVDEVILYARGSFSSRRGVGPGSISHHPAGVPHGPHPETYESSPGTTRTDELAVMLDCALPLEATPDAVRVEDLEYHDSFIAPARF
jgi:homogentisate 1,2-dioxygenase